MCDIYPRTSIDPTYRYITLAIIYLWIVGQYPWHGDNSVHNYYNMCIILYKHNTITIYDEQSLPPPPPRL